MNNKHRDKIWRIISSIKFGMICYPEGNGYKSKPMTLIQDNLQDKLFFFTKVESEDYLKFQEPKKVLVNFSDPKTGQYVSINAEANLNRNQHLIDQFWSFSTSAWFPEGKDNPSICLIEVEIVDGECWENPKGSFRTFIELIIAKLKGKKPDLGRKIIFN
jgi:general stress protein 26